MDKEGADVDDLTSLEQPFSLYVAERMLGPGKRATSDDYHDTTNPAFVRKSKKEAEAARRDGDYLSDTGDSQQAFHDKPYLSELAGSWHSSSWLKAEPEVTFRVGSSLSSVDRTLDGSSLSSEDTTAPQYSRYLVYRDSDTSAQPFKPPIPSVFHTDDLELSMGPGSTSCGRVCPEFVM